MADRQRLQDLYRQAAVFVLPSLCDPSPLVLLEAMAHGLPCVGTKVGAMPEFISDGDTGLLVPPGDASALAGAMEQFLTDGDARGCMGQTGRKRLEKQFTWKQTVGRMNAELLASMKSFQAV